MTRKIKVLQLQNRYNVNASDLAEQVIQGLPTQTYEVTTLFLRGRPRSGEPESRAARSVYFDLNSASTKGLRLKALWLLYKHCRAQGYDVVIAHRFKPINMIMLLNIFLRIPACVGVLHGLGEYERPYRRWESRALISKAWRMVGVSRAVCDDLINSGAGFKPYNVRQINNAIDISRAERLQHSKLQARKLLGLPEDAFVIGTIGRLVPVKGHIQLLEAFSEIKDDYPQALLVIIGEGRLRQEMEAVIQARGLNGRVHLLGAKDDALQYVRAYDVFVMSSISEGLPLALLEGMSARLPVVGSDIDSMRPILEESGGRIYPVGQSAILAKRLREVVLLTPQERTKEGRRTYEYLCRAHAIEDFRKQYRDLLEEMLGAGKQNHE
ncbi:MAG: glycosyl transferase family 1 [Pseudomonas sp. BICA1-14]|uniref:glycosyltransferase n=1 Tax=Stutzerimonas kunmingensis TaxID=1211807 RepID=UPI0005B4193C|nr:MULTISPECIES: glycosyltransferase [Stutzerimonas stutzeri group]KJS80930.1 MAG: glycosyl transferase family 1 [[Pseudomonas] sp. BICA1-14]HBW09234.1 glycosyltransferase [Pseudomonas sp.]